MYGKMVVIGANGDYRLCFVKYFYSVYTNYDLIWADTVRVYYVYYEGLQKLRRRVKVIVITATGSG